MAGWQYEDQEVLTVVFTLTLCAFRGGQTALEVAQKEGVTVKQRLGA